MMRWARHEARMVEKKNMCAVFWRGNFKEGGNMEIPRRGLHYSGAGYGQVLVSCEHVK